MNLAHRVSERFWEWRLGIQTLGWMAANELGLPPGSRSYTATPYSGFVHVMKQIPKPFTRGCFVDIGCGMGRTLVLAKRCFPFSRAVGVELNPQLCSIARVNTKSLKDVEVIQADARFFDFPEDSSVVFLFNPFGGEMLRTVVANIEALSHELMVVVCNYEEFMEATRMECIARGQMRPNISWALFHSKQR